MDIDQKQLLQDFVNNDLDAFRKVYQLYFNKLLKYGRIFSNDKMLVEDVIQELFTKLLQNKNKQILNLDTYLFKAVKQNIINKISRENRRENIRNLIVQDVEIRSYEEKFIENEDLTIKREWILTKVDSLSPRQKEIFFLKYHEYLSYKEIETITGLNQQILRNYIYKIISFLKKSSSQNKGLRKET